MRENDTVCRVGRAPLCQPTAHIYAPYPTITAEALLQDWEALACPTPSAAYPAARAAMHTVLDLLLPCLNPEVDVNLDPEDLRHLLHRASTLRGGTAAAIGLRRAEEAVELALASAVWLGSAYNELPLRGLLFFTSNPAGELEMDELSRAIEHLGVLMGTPLEVLFGHSLLPTLPTGALSVSLLLAYGPLLPGGSPPPLPSPTLTRP